MNLLPVPVGAPKLTSAQVLRATAEALAAKSKAEHDAASTIHKAAWGKFRAKVAKLARARLKDTVPEVREWWDREGVTVSFTVKFIKAELPDMPSIAVPDYVEADEFERKLRKALSVANQARVQEMVKDPDLQKKFVELGEKMLLAEDKVKAIDA